LKKKITPLGKLASFAISKFKSQPLICGSHGVAHGSLTHVEEGPTWIGDYVCGVVWEVCGACECGSDGAT